MPVAEDLSPGAAGPRPLPDRDRRLALVVSPVRSWPLDQGNRARIAALGGMLKDRGYAVHFLLSQLEGGASAAEIAKMEGQWDLLRCLPYGHRRRQSHAEAWGGDDWYDPALDAAARDLARVWDYDLCLVNYAWYSRVFEVLPARVVRVIDTHDAFGDRHRRLHAAGTTPVWYYTRPEDEGRCLDRADFVIAIQDEEAGWFRSLTAQPVRTFGHAPAPPFLPPRPHRRAGDRLRAGYLASGNPSNLVSIAELIRHWASDPFLSARVELHLAGPICAALGPVAHRFVVMHGFVPEVEAFYGSVDIAVNPNIGGSGLKIKSVEALSYGRPLFATVEGMLGICGVDPPFVLPGVARMVQQMSRHLQAAPDLAQATLWARRIYLGYRNAQIAAFDALLAEAEALRAGRRGEGSP